MDIEEEIQADLARYGAVLICGYVERCAEVIIIERLARKAHPRVINFVKSHFKRGTNYNCIAISELLERFDLDWARRFREFCDSNAQHVTEIESAYNLRNSIAHGGDATRGMAGVGKLFFIGAVCHRSAHRGDRLKVLRRRADGEGRADRADRHATGVSRRVPAGPIRLQSSARDTRR